MIVFDGLRLMGLAVAVTVFVISGIVFVIDYIFRVVKKRKQKCIRDASFRQTKRRG